MDYQSGEGIAPEEYEELDELSRSLYGASDKERCTYPRGYLKRQALMACLTCTKDDNPAGVCVACCRICHRGHDVVEVYTRRNFRCDCGNSKFFPYNPCLLVPDKSSFNELNVYNANFRGHYCICMASMSRTSADEQVWCTMCENWFHEGDHFGGDVAPDAVEAICVRCVALHPFLWFYFLEEIHHDVEESTFEFGQPPQERSNNEGTLESRKCVYEGLLSKWKEVPIDSCAYWYENWRQRLCRCQRCVQMYHDLGCTYLLEDEDTLEVYEQRGRQAFDARYRKHEESFNKLDRMRQVEVIHQVNEFKGELTEFIDRHTREKRPLHLQDIQNFAEEMKARKRARIGL